MIPHPRSRCSFLSLTWLTLACVVSVAPAQQPDAPAQQPAAPNAPAQQPNGPAARGGGRGGVRPHANYNAELPTIWLIGDSTVKEGTDNGLTGGRWGWGHEIDRYFDLRRVNVENQALGGTSSRSFNGTNNSRWGGILALMKPGDYVLMQFGHNDGGLTSMTPRIRARATLPGSGDETQEMALENGEMETVHTHGWYLRRFITDIKAKGANPVVCSLIPRNTWRDGKVVRGQDNSYVLWAREAAEKENVPFINLNHIICEQMDQMGEQFALGGLFRPDDGTHTVLLGAQLNAMCVVSGIKGLDPATGLAKYLSPVADPVEPATAENVVSPKAP